MQGLRNGVFCLLLGLVGCGHNPATVPVVERSAGKLNHSGVYIVQPGDSLYSIAWNYGLEYRGLARANGLHSPYMIRPGDRLQLRAVTPAARRTSAPPAARPGTAKPAPKPVTDGLPMSNTQAWSWPATGRVLAGYAVSGKVHKGIDIQGKSGQPVSVAKAGKVVYAGSGLKAYGLLVIVKHDARYLSAYAYNLSTSVKEGDMVKQGQQIARMGSKDGTQSMLHFEIRRDGKTVDPRSLLPRR